MLWFPSSAPPSKWFSNVPYPIPPSIIGAQKIPVSPSGCFLATSPRPVTRVIARSVSLTLDTYVPPATPLWVSSTENVSTRLPIRWSSWSRAPGGSVWARAAPAVSTSARAAPLRRSNPGRIRIAPAPSIESHERSPSMFVPSGSPGAQNFSSARSPRRTTGLSPSAGEITWMSAVTRSHGDSEIVEHLAAGLATILRGPSPPPGRRRAPPGMRPRRAGPGSGTGSAPLRRLTGTASTRPRVGEARHSASSRRSVTGAGLPVEFLLERLEFRRLPQEARAAPRSRSTASGSSSKLVGSSLK